MADSPGQVIAKSTIAILGIGFVFTAIGLQFGPTALGIALAVLVALGLATDATGNISTAFTLTAFAVTVLLIQVFAPPAILDSISSVFASIGFPIFSLNPVVLLFWAVVAILASWIVDIRFIRQSAKKPNTVVSRLSKRAQRLIDEYASITRVVAIGLVGIVAVVFEQGSEFAAEFGDILAQAPAFVANAVTGVIGFLALGGSLPVIGPIPLLEGLTPMLWLGVVVVIVVLAWGARES